LSVIDIALKIKAKNGALQTFIDENGWTQAEFARQVGVAPAEVGRWFNMKGYPHDAQIMLRVAILVGRLLEELFPPELMDRDWLTGTRNWTLHREVDLECLPIHHMTALPAPSDDVDAFALKEAIQGALTTLTPREETIVKMRVGLVDNVVQTYEEIGEIFGLTTERIRQIEYKALRKLKHPARKKLLEDFI
jgi:RNA polymerase sigma factor (sigma-70 family)